MVWVGVFFATRLEGTLLPLAKTRTDSQRLARPQTLCDLNAISPPSQQTLFLLISEEASKERGKEREGRGGNAL